MGLPDHVRRAERTGHYRAGRGPYYCTRILSTHVPEVRQLEILGGTSRRTVERDYVRLTRTTVFRKRHVGDSGDFGAYAADIIARARAHHIAAPDRIIAGWAAAAFHGLPYWADSAPVVMLAPGRSEWSDRTETAAAAPLRATLRRQPVDLDLRRDTVCPDPEFPALRVVSAEIALVQCLRSVLSGKHDWPTVPVPGLDERMVRAVQLIDAFAQCTYVGWHDMCAAASGKVSKRTLRTLMPLVSLGAESPRETLLRLLVRDVLPAGHQWETQVRVDYTEQTGSGRSRDRWTVFDLACRTLRLGLYYDGAHHTAESQMEKDFEQLQDLTHGKWTVVRVNRKLMGNRAKMMAQVRSAVDGAEREATSGPSE